MAGSQLDSSRPSGFLVGLVQKIERSPQAPVLNSIPQMSIPEIATLLQSVMTPNWQGLDAVHLATELKKIVKDLRMRESLVPCPDRVIVPTLNTFDPFPNLPIEIRVKIWGMALPRSRILKFTTNSHIGYNFSISKSSHMDIVHIMLANKESRGVVLSRYKYIPASRLGLELPAPASAVIKSSRIFLDPKMDIPYFEISSPGLLVQIFRSRLRCKVSNKREPYLTHASNNLFDEIVQFRTFAMCARRARYLNFDGYNNRFITDFLPKMAELKQLMVVDLPCYRDGHDELSIIPCIQPETSSSAKSRNKLMKQLSAKMKENYQSSSVLPQIRLEMMQEFYEVPPAKLERLSDKILSIHMEVRTPSPSLSMRVYH
jgi:hypothetical protein